MKHRRKRRRFNTETNLLHRIGWSGLVRVASKAGPPVLSTLILPYHLLVYRRFLLASSSIRELWRLHDYELHNSAVFRLLSGDYDRIDRILRGYDIPCGDVKTVRPGDPRRHESPEDNSADRYANAV